jgi:hypothetical protein
MIKLRGGEDLNIEYKGEISMEPVKITFGYMGREYYAETINEMVKNFDSKPHFLQYADGGDPYLIACEGDKETDGETLYRAMRTLQNMVDTDHIVQMEEGYNRSAIEKLAEDYDDCYREDLLMFNSICYVLLSGVWYIEFTFVGCPTTYLYDI